MYRLASRASLTSLHPSFLNRESLRLASELAGCILGEHSTEQLQQLLLQAKPEGRKSFFLHIEIILIKILFCDLFHPEISQVSSESSCKITSGMKQLFFIHWTGNSVRDVPFFSEESCCLPGLILSYKMVFHWGEIRSVIGALQHNLLEQEGGCEKQILFSVLYQKRSLKSLYLQLYNFFL